MNPGADYEKQALDGVRALRYLAARGDAEAAAGLLAVAVEAAEHVAALHDFPEEKNVMVEIAATARQWPMNLPAIQELQPRALACIPVGLGSDLPFRAAKGATKLRVFHGNSGPQLALTAFLEMEKIRTETAESDKQAYRDLWHLLPERLKEDWRILAALLPPLADTSVPAWKEAGTRWAEYQCQGRWKTFPWPAEVIDRAEQPTSSRKRGIETAVKEILGNGFSVIARRLPIIPPR